MVNSSLEDKLFKETQKRMKVLSYLVVERVIGRIKRCDFFAKRGGNDEILELMVLSQACGVPRAHQPKRIMCPLKK